MIKAVMLLEDGTVFHGLAAGHAGECLGELVFNTAHTGYEEVLSDPSYLGQIVTFTTAHIGNTGITEEDLESSFMFAEALICKELSPVFDNHRAKQSLVDYLKGQKKFIFYDIDTRYLTQILREKGCLNAIISCQDFDLKSLQEKLLKSTPLSEINAIEVYANKQSYKIENKGAKYKVAVIDFGIKRGIIDNLKKYNLELHFFKYDTPAEEILKTKPDALFLSNGPGNPAMLTFSIEQIKILIKTLPTFGICLGHQLLAHAFGGSTFKMGFGHHATNHPVSYIRALTEDIPSVEITSQNHNYAVNLEAILSEVEITHRHLNDQTVSGMKHNVLNVFSVQYHPESNPGPHDSRYLFQQFFTLIEKAATH